MHTATQLQSTEQKTWGGGTQGPLTSALGPLRSPGFLSFHLRSSLMAASLLVSITGVKMPGAEGWGAAPGGAIVRGIGER